VQHDPFASFYGGYDVVARARGARRHVGIAKVLLVGAIIVLLGFILADVAAFRAIPARVEVTGVEWYVGGEPLTNASGFTLHASQSIQLTLTCSFVCYEFVGATASAPFQVTSFHVVYQPIQFVNVTVAAPSAAYDGPLAINLEPVPTGQAVD
jgi:hypothetical protein